MALVFEPRLLPLATNYVPRQPPADSNCLLPAKDQALTTIYQLETASCKLLQIPSSSLPATSYNLAIYNTRFPSSPSIISVPFFLLFGFNKNKGTKKKKDKRVLLGNLERHCCDALVASRLLILPPSATQRTQYPLIQE